MIRAFQAELIKLRRPRVLYGSLGALFGFTLLVTVLTFITAKKAATASTDGQGEGNTIEQLIRADGLTIGFTNAARLVGVVVLVVFLTSITSEYGLGTVRVLLVRQPRRGLFLAGKLLALLVSTAAALLVAQTVGMVAATLVANARGIPTDAWFTADGLSAAVGVYTNAVLACGFYGTLGMALGVLLRSTPLAVGITLGWFIMVENIADNVWADAGHWFPGLLADAVSAGGVDAVSYVHASIGVFGYAAVALTIGSVTFARRDVST
jgi:ABC-type transport system involved in multi-copper enzyme maturation permease subunit